MKYTLEINQLTLKVFIGVEPYEHEEIQDIEFSIIVNFAQMPAACISDDIKDALCYADLVARVESFCTSRKFHLIEHLGFSLYQHLQENMLNQADQLGLKICKKPPLDSVKGNCCFTINC